MAASGTAVFTNPDDYRAVIDDATLDLFLTGPGDFKARLTWLKLDNLHIFRGRENLPRIAYLSLAPTRTFVSFPLISSPQPVWNGEKAPTRRYCSSLAGRTRASVDQRDEPLGAAIPPTGPIDLLLQNSSRAKPG